MGETCSETETTYSEEKVKELTQALQSCSYDTWDMIDELRAYARYHPSEFKESDELLDELSIKATNLLTRQDGSFFMNLEHKERQDQHLDRSLPRVVKRHRDLCDGKPLSAALR